MSILGILLLVLFIISAILLIFLVLIQDDQGEGLGGLFGGGGSSTAFGSRSGNILTRFTSILAAIFLLSSFGLAWLNRSPEEGDVVGAARRAGAEERQLEWWAVEDESEASDSETAEEEVISEEELGAQDSIETEPSNE
ncbi:MAG: preprotein translocase subunit SecG [Spirochaetia bacterium]